MDIQDYKIRFDRIYSQMKKAGADACLLSTHVNLFYVCGRIYGGYYYISASGDHVAFVKRPNNATGLPRLHFIHKLEQIPDLLREEGIPLPQRMLFEGEETGYDEYHRLMAAFPTTELLNGSHAMRIVRSVKTPVEQELIRQSARAHAEVYRLVPSVYRHGMTDRDLMFEIEFLARKHGNLGLLRSFGNMDAFMGILLAGDNAAVPSPYDYALGGAGVPSNPIGVTGIPLKQGQSVMVDLSGDFSGYLDDMTRTFSIGKLPEKAYYAHQVSIDINNRMQQEMREGAVCEDLYDLSLQMATDAGLADCFMGTRQQAKFVGHGVGLVINELPVLAHKINTVLEPGMVIALEPKFVIEGVGAVGIEDTYIVGKTESERVTHLGNEIIDLEA